MSEEVTPGSILARTSFTLPHPELGRRGCSRRLTTRGVVCVDFEGRVLWNRLPLAGRVSMVEYVDPLDISSHLYTGAVVLGIPGWASV